MGTMGQEEEASSHPFAITFADRMETATHTVHQTVRGLDVRDVLEGLDLQHATLIGGSMGANTIWSYVAQCGTDRLSAAVTVDESVQRGPPRLPARGLTNLRRPR
jgi:pimeloyl-ACP methyl ester carboxylesterase